MTRRRHRSGWPVTVALGVLTGLVYIGGPVWWLLFAASAVLGVAVLFARSWLNARRVIGRVRPARTFTQDDKIAIAVRAGGRCEHRTLGVRCRETANLQYDHVRPWSRGGPSTAANGQLLCAAHNQSKGNRT